ncbi:SURF1 family protein [Cupriavidus taiwanensis]|uniref:SURF1 family protein n=1 Tax=Cupriavidus taiwanensis TaxID=164546 RepID=UPI00157200E3|nr:SURF1 family protein [Cupriavidus taiwanensis]NSX17108.1 SURF1 family protein [Cupriavidus taiwanensis]
MTGSTDDRAPVGNPRTDNAAKGSPESPRPLPTVWLTALALLAAAAIAGLVALGNWQVERRAWKLGLIAQVAERVHAPPVAAPAPAQWPGLTRANAEYRRVRASGTFLDDRQTLVQAVTEQGGGYWVMTPLRLADGSTVLVNRGFVAEPFRARVAPAGSGAGEVVGLLRMSEPGTGLLRHNDAARDQWFSRDVAAIAARRGLDGNRVAPYFIDAAAVPPPAGVDAKTWPAGGLTVTTFTNNHLGYALTWYGLALMVAAGAAYVGREEYRKRRA